MRAHAGVPVLILVLLALAGPASPAAAQPAAPPATGPGVPPVIAFRGTVAHPEGSLQMTFALYSEQSGGEPLWVETQTVGVDAAGRYSVVLGAAVPIPLVLFASGEARWLGVSLDGEREQPRVLLVSVPYAMKAADAETVGGKPVSSFVLAGERTGVGADGLTYVDRRVLGKALSGGTAAASPEGTFGSPGYIGVFTDTVNLGNSVIFQSSGNIGVNTTAPQAAFHAMASAAPGAFFDVYSNALGALPVVYRAARGTPASPLAVQTDDILGGLAVRGYGATRFSAGQGQVMFKAAENWTDAAHGTYLSMTTTPLGSASWVERLRIDPAGRVIVGDTVPAPSSLLTLRKDVASAIGPVLTLMNGGGFGGAGGAIDFFTTSVAAGGAIPAIRVQSSDNNYSGDLIFSTRVPGGGGALTERMRLTNTGSLGIGTSPPYAKLDVRTSVSDATAILASALGSNGIAIYGEGDYRAGVFMGNVDVNGNLVVSGTVSKGGGSFKIDHPLDPENKYLSHSFVESPDMMNIYNGVAPLDAKGEAVVTLPDWFEALNRDFRYQLTPIGAFMPLYIAEEIAGNRFKIAGGMPGKKVSWQVTGIRHDAYADAHRIRVEEEKTGAEKGTYLHPEAFGQPESKRLHAARPAPATAKPPAGPRH